MSNENGTMLWFQRREGIVFGLEAEERSLNTSDRIRMVGRHRQVRYAVMEVLEMNTKAWAEAYREEIQPRVASKEEKFA
jgi:phosphopantetheinyl transferase